LPSAFHELYQWHDGQSFDCYEAFQDNRVFMALDDARESHEILTELLDAGEFQRANWWSRHWVPFLYNGAGDYVCVDLAGTFTGQVGQIIEFWHDDAGRNVIAPSLEAWLADYAALLERTEWEYYAETGEEPFLDWESSMPGYPLRFTAG
jgi:cell wall assembly regulator SMI1